MNLFLAKRLSRRIAGTFSTVGFSAMADTKNFDGRFVSEFKEQPVISTVETKACLRRLELLYIARARSEIAIGAVENVERGLTVDAA